MRIDPLTGIIPVRPDPHDPHGLVGVGGRITEESILAAYRAGIFPWTGRHPIPWCSPDPRALLAPGAVRVTRSLDKRMRNAGFEVRLDQDLPAVIAACATVSRPGQPGTWITPNLVRAWTALWRRGLAHSVEVFQGGERVGGLYGLSLGAAFFGESMFHTAKDASKVALVSLCRLMEARGMHFVDCQAMTPHLERMGAEPVPRAEYRRRLQQALAEPTLKGSWAEVPAAAQAGAPPAPAEASPGDAGSDER